MIKSRLFPTLLCLLGIAAARAQLPAAPTLTYPGDMARNIPVSTSLKWKKPAAATGYHVQLATEPGFAAPFFEDSALVDTLASVKRLSDSTTYYWRVRARSAMGFGAYSKIRSFTTNPPLGAGPVIVSPEHFALGLPLSPTLAWNTFPGAKTYGVQVSTANNFSTILFQDTSVADTVLNITGLVKGTLYYWHVRANTSPVKTAWTKSNFTTLTDPPTAPAVLSIPADGAKDLPLTIDLAWESVERASGYVYQVSTKADFSTVDKTDSSSISTAQVEGLAPNTVYHWRVKGNSASGEAPYSAGSTFTTGNGAAGMADRIARNGKQRMRIEASARGIAVEFTLTARTPVALTVYGALGRRTQVLALAMLDAGTHRITGLISGSKKDGSNAGASGIHWIELRAGETREVRRIVLP